MVFFYTLSISNNCIYQKFVLSSPTSSLTFNNTLFIGIKINNFIRLNRLNINLTYKYISATELGIFQSILFILLLLISQLRRKHLDIMPSIISSTKVLPYNFKPLICCMLDSISFSFTLASLNWWMMAHLFMNSSVLWSDNFICFTE